jgi:hypothetical protein
VSGRFTEGEVAPIPAESDAYLTPEVRAHREIDQQLQAAGWAVQDADAVNLAAARDVAVRESLIKPPPGRADSLWVGRVENFVDLVRTGAEAECLRR